MLMIERIAVIGGDARQMWLAQALLRSGLRVRCAEVPGMDDEPGGLYGALDGAQAAALPMPSCAFPLSTPLDVQAASYLAASVRMRSFSKASMIESAPCFRTFIQIVCSYKL